jgi:hypothetical protein
MQETLGSNSGTVQKKLLTTLNHGAKRKKKSKVDWANTSRDPILTYPEKNHYKKELAGLLKWEEHLPSRDEALSSNSSAAKKKKKVKTVVME